MAKSKKPTEKTEDQPTGKVEELKGLVKEAKVNLTNYYKDNKLKRDEDYSDDPKHGVKIGKLQKAIEKAESKLTEAVDSEAPAKGKKEKKAKSGSSAGRETKYEYPADCVTAEDKKKFRIQARKAAEGGSKPKKEKAEKPAKGKKEEVVEETTAKTSKKKKTKAPVEKEVPTGKAKKKKAKKSNDD